MDSWNLKWALPSSLLCGLEIREVNWLRATTQGGRTMTYTLESTVRGTMLFNWSVLLFFPFITERKYLWSLWSDYPSGFCSNCNPESCLKLYHLNVAFSKRGNFCIIGIKGSAVLKEHSISYSINSICMLSKGNSLGQIRSWRAEK